MGRNNSSCAPDHCTHRRLRQESGAQRSEFTWTRTGGQVQRRTFTPLTMVVLHTLTGLRTTTAPRGPAQPARTTPSAQTTARAVRDSRVMVAPNANRADAMI